MNTMKSEHTAGKWIISPIMSRKNGGEAEHYYAIIFSRDINGKKVVCDLDFGYGQKADEANAAFIVRACNNYHIMLKALQTIADADIIDVEAIQLRYIARDALDQTKQEQP